jgi:tRNA (guanine37-N1)-methyltransferase
VRIDVLTLFPEAFHGPLDVSIIRRAREAGLLDFHVTDIRDYAIDRHRTVDGYPFGGGHGMVLRVDVLDEALTDVQAKAEPSGLVVYLSPQGERLTDALVRELAAAPRLVLVCGRYEGVDQRFVEHRVDREISIGDYILTGGELPAMVLVDAVARHIPGALGDEASPEAESFSTGLLEEPHYTRPAQYRDWAVPDVLLGGDHAAIERWKREQRVERTRARRPDLLPPASSAPAVEKKGTGVPGLRIRPFQYPADLPAVLDLWREAGPGIALRASDSPAELARKLQRDPELFLVATLQKQIVAAVMGGFDGRRGYVYHLAVSPSTRRHGIAEALMAELEARLRTLGCIRMNLLITGDNPEAEPFWQHLGWHKMDVSAWGKDL